MNCERKGYSWEEVADAVDTLFSEMVNPQYAERFPTQSYVKDVCKSALPSAMRHVLEWCFIHDEMDDPRLQIIKDGYKQLEDKGWIGHVL